MPPCPGAETQEQETVPGSGPKPGGRAGRCERSSARPLPQDSRRPNGSPGCPSPCPCPTPFPGRAVGVLTVPGERAAAFLCSAPCLRPRPGGTSRRPPALPHRPGPDVPLPPSSACIQETTPLAPSGPAALSQSRHCPEGAPSRSGPCRWPETRQAPGAPLNE